MLKALLFLLFVVPPLIAFKLLMVLLGLIFVPVGLLKAKVTEPPEHDSRVVDDPWQFVKLQPDWLDNIWGSRKYGAQGNWFWNDDQDTTKFWPRFNWLALRNPVSNLEVYFPWYEIKDCDNSKIKYVGEPIVSDVLGFEGAQLSWYGWRAGFHYIKKWTNDRCLRVRIGFKLEPHENGTSSPNLTFIIAPWTDFGK